MAGIQYSTNYRKISSKIQAKSLRQLLIFYDLNKNIQKIGGLPLIKHTIISAKKSKKIDKILISTDDRKILKISRGKKSKRYIAGNECRN